MRVLHEVSVILPLGEAWGFRATAASWVVGLLWLTSPGAASAETQVDCPDEHAGPAFIVSAQALPRVDGWDPGFGHRSGWGTALGVDVSPWSAPLELHVETSYLTNRSARLWSIDAGLKIPFHRGEKWDVHAVVGPAVAWERGRVQRPDGETEQIRDPVVGVIAGVGTSYWFTPSWGLSVDLNYRALGGEGIAHRLYQGLGVALRL